MRTKILVIILLSLGSYANAGPVTQEMAQEVARAFLLKEQTTPPQVATKIKGEFIVSNQAAGLVLGDIHPITDERGEILAYVQELEPQGFIITSADDAIRAVLGFSFTDKFLINDIRARPLLDLVTADVYARKNLASAGSKETVELRFSTQWGPWLQTEWHQAGHWNDKCPYVIPYIPGGNRPAGCVAIATAQIVNYWKYPKSISFSSIGDSYLSGSIDIFGDAGIYGFPTASELSTALQSILYNGDSDEEAYLCFGIGVKTEMEYGVFSSGAYSYKVAEALTDKLDYGCATYKHGDLVWNKYRDDVIRNMKDGWPAYLGISKHWLPLMGGHAVVADGYRDSDGYFHVNLGWEFPSVWNIWYDLPNIKGYSLIHSVIFDVAKYQGWNQYGADAQNTFSSPYPAPDGEDTGLKWRATCPDGFSFSNILIGTSNHVYAAVSPNASSGHSFVYVIDQFGTTLRQIEIDRDGKIYFMCQSQDGDLFAAVEDGGIYRVDPKQGTAIQIFVEPYGGQINTLKIDEEGWLFAVTFDRVYALTRTGGNRWSAPFVVPAGAMFLGSPSIPAIDVSRQRVYIMYRNNSPTYYGYLAALNRLDGQAVHDPRDFGRTVPALKVPSLGADGTVYIGGAGKLYALDPDDFLGTPRWTKSLLISQTPAVGRNGTLYFPYWEEISGTWYNKLGAFDPSNGTERWSITFQLDESEEAIFQPYIASNGVVLFTIERPNKYYTLYAYKDNGSSVEELWQYDAGTSGGDYAFGPGRTVYSWGKTGLAQTIYALSDGDVGDPFGAGEDFENNNAPMSASNPSPADGADGQDADSVQLSWDCSDPDGHALKYDIYACALVDTEEAAFVPVASQVTANSYWLTGLQGETQYLWSVVATDGQAVAEGPVWSFVTTSTDVAEESGQLSAPEKFALFQNYPNPFNPNTQIEYELKNDCQVKVTIYNILGQTVRTLVDEYQTKGRKLIYWNGEDNEGNYVSSGIYFYSLDAKEFTQTKKMLLLK